MPPALMCPKMLLDKDLSGKVIVVTGANSGIGLVTAQQLAKQGATVVMGCRRVEAGQQAADSIRAEVPSAELEVRQLDLGDLSSVRSFALELLAAHEALSALVNNAGVMNTPEGRTKDGFETQLGVNHLGHFLLTELLTGALKAGAPARIVCVSSCYHDQAMGRDGHIDFDDLMFESRKYDGWEAYAQSKLANLLHAKGLAGRLQGTGVQAVSVHPGWVRTDLARHSMPLWVQNIIMRPFMKLTGMIEPWAGAQTTLYAILADDIEDGAFYSQTGTYRDRAANKGGWPLKSPNPEANKLVLVEKLWERSEALVGLT
ncbi:MAG: NAD(P)-dependent dehydrogenase (short-subunit alcohol dehydrogenase family) [Myxococcota bacterium]|jgi:NAD(P)-dependent dehydrogenase (short-subunit alcohol dehydrogenase family)